MSAALVILPNFLLILCGTVLARRFDYGRAFWDNLEKLVYFVLFPALLFRSLMRANIDVATARDFVAAGIVVMLCGIALSAVPRWFRGIDLKVFAGGFQCGFRFNSYLGLAAVSALSGKDGVTLLAILIGFLVPMANIAAVYALTGHGGSGFWREIARNPLILSTGGGLVANLLGLRLPFVLDQTLELLGTAALPAGLLAVGAALRLDGSRTAPFAQGWWMTVKLLLLPLVAAVTAWQLRLTPLEATVLITWAALPTASSAYILAARMGADAKPVAAQITLQTLLSMVTLPLLVAGWIAWTARG
jgi:malonate transporter and related proteins